MRKERSMGSRRRSWRVTTMSAALVVMMWTGPLPSAAQSIQEREDRARELYDQEQYLQPADSLQQILRREPQNPAANVLLPFALARLDNIQGAIAQTRQALELFPAN